MSALRFVAPVFVGMLCLSSVVRAETVSIFDMRKSLPLDPDEQATREFYVNAGPEAGLRDGLYARVMRMIPVHDPIANKAQATMMIPVGYVKIIHAERGIAVARPYGELTDDDRPTLEYEGIMIGDRIDLSTASADEPRLPKKRAHRRAEAAPPARPTSVIVLAPEPAAAPVPAEKTVTQPVPPVAPAAPQAAGAAKSAAPDSAVNAPPKAGDAASAAPENAAVESRGAA